MSKVSRFFSKLTGKQRKLELELYKQSNKALQNQSNISIDLIKCLCLKFGEGESHSLDIEREITNIVGAKDFDTKLLNIKSNDNGLITLSIIERDDYATE